MNAAHRHHFRELRSAPGVAALLIALALLTTMPGAWAAPGNIYQVNSAADTDDGVCNAANCTLRDAIRAANGHDGLDTILFNLPGSPPYIIQPATQLPAITEPLLLDGLSQPGIEILGGNCPATPCHGLTITGDNVTVQGLTIGGFVEGYGIYLKGASLATVRANLIGAGSGGGNGKGVRIENGCQNLIGGPSPADRNVISGNLEDGVFIAGSGANGNKVQGNYIGVDAAGTAVLANGSSGVVISAPGNTVGGSESGARNVISGNGMYGIWITPWGMNNVIAGNTVGLDATGTLALGNGPAADGVVVAGPDNTIGGTTPGASNVISGNAGCGVWITGSWATGNQVQGNIIGPGPGGTLARVGPWLARGPALAGWRSQGAQPGRAGGALGNEYCGVLVDSASDNTVGGAETGMGNVISGNATDGVLIEGLAAKGNQVQGNLIGTTADGALALGNGGAGVAIGLDASANIIGGVTSGARNVISGNTGPGVELDEAASGNLVQGNDIGLNGTGEPALGNGGAGVVVTSGTGNGIMANRIGGNQGLGIDLTGNGVVPNDPGDLDEGPNLLQNYPVLTAAVTTGVSAEIQGTLNSQPNTTYRIEFFANSACHPSGYGEGASFLGSVAVITDGAGNATFSGTTDLGAPPGSFFTTTATDPDGNTSEFSKCIASTFHTPTPTSTATLTDTPTVTPASTETASPTTTASPTVTGTPTATPLPSATCTPTPSARPHRSSIYLPIVVRDAG